MIQWDRGRFGAALLISLTAGIAVTPTKAQTSCDCDCEEGQVPGNLTASVSWNIEIIDQNSEEEPCYTLEVSGEAEICGLMCGAVVDLDGTVSPDTCDRGGQIPEGEFTGIASLSVSEGGIWDFTISFEGGQIEDESFTLGTIMSDCTSWSYTYYDEESGDSESLTLTISGECQDAPDPVTDICEQDGSGEESVGETCPTDQEDIQDDGGTSESAHPVAYATGHKMERSNDLSVSLPGRDFVLTREYSSNPDLYLGHDAGTYYWRGMRRGVVPGHVGVNWSMGIFRTLIGDHERGNSDVLWLGGPLRSSRAFYRVDSTTTFVPAAASNQYITPEEVLIPGFGTTPREVYRVRQPGGIEIDFARWPSSGAAGTGSFGLEDMVGLPVFERDEHGNTWWFEYTMLSTGPTGLRDVVVLKSVYLNWDGGTDNTITSDDTWAARVDFLWNGQSGTPYSAVTASTSGQPNHHYGRLAEVRVIRRPTGSSEVVTDKARYVYFDDIKDIQFPGESCTLGSQYDGTPGDLVEVVVSTAVDADEDVATDGSFFERVWQYRYHITSAYPIELNTGSGPTTYFEGTSHQLLAVFYPEQIEFFADHFIRLGGAVSTATPLVPSIVQAAHHLRWITFWDKPDAIIDSCAYDDWEDYFKPNDEWQTLFDVASKVIGYYGIDDPAGDGRVRVQVVKSSGGAGCGCGGSAGTLRVGRKFDYLYKRFFSFSFGNGSLIPEDELEGWTPSNGYSCQIVESRLVLDGSNLKFQPYRVHLHDYLLKSERVVGDLKRGGNLGLPWKLAETVAEANPLWTFGGVYNPVAEADEETMAGRRWTTRFLYSDEEMFPTTGIFAAYHQVSRVYTPSSLNWSDYEPAEGENTSTSAVVLPGGLTTGLSYVDAFELGWVGSRTFMEGNASTGVTPMATTYNGLRPDLVSQITRTPALASAGTVPQEQIDFTYGYYNATDPDLERIVAWRRSTVLAEIEAQNGSPSVTSYTTLELYDRNGQLRWEQDTDGRLTYREYDALTGALTKIVRDADPSAGGSGLTPGSTNFPGLTGYTAPSGPYTQLTDQFVVDAMGRVISHTDSSGVTRRTRREVRESDMVIANGSLDARGIPYFATVHLPFQLADDTLDGPVTVSWTDAQGRSIRESAFEVDGGEEYNPATGVYTATEVARSDAERMITGVPVRSRVWHRIGDTTNAPGDRPFANTGSYVTSMVYDSLGRVAMVVDAEDGVTEYKDYDIRDRATTLWQGTTGWDSNGAMTSISTVQTATFFFDSPQTEVQGVGNGNLTLIRQKFNGTPGDDRITKRWFDYRDRVVGTLNPLAPHQTLAYDNLNRPISAATFTSGTGFTGSVVPDPDTPHATRSTYTQTLYNNRGLVYRTRAAIDPIEEDEQFQTFLETNRWFDGDGMVIATWSPNSPAVKTVYDTLDRPSVVSTTDRGGDAVPGTTGNYADAAAVTGDAVLEQVEYTYVANGVPGAGAPELITNRQRPHNATTTGALSAAANISTYTLSEFDEVGRQFRTYAYGTNNAAFTKNTSPPNLLAGTSNTPTTGALISEIGFDGWGRSILQTSPAGDKTLVALDAMSRQVAVVEAQTTVQLSNITWSGTVQNWEVNFPSGASSELDRVTTFAYDGLSNVVKRTAHLTGSSAQTTLYDYGTTAASGSNPMDSLAASSRLLSTVHYPNESTGASDLGATYTVSYAYNRLGELRGMTDQNGTLHQYTRDALGRVTADSAAPESGNPHGLDLSVRSLVTVYDAHGQVQEVRSEDASSVELNSVEFGYTPMRQLATLTQHVGTSTGVVAYTYDYAAPSATGGNHARVSSVRYPSQSTGSTVDMDFGDPGSTSDRIGRVTGLEVPGWTVSTDELVDYTYLGLGTPVQVLYPATTAGLGLDHTKAASGADGTATSTYHAFDQFGRVVRHAWVTSGYSTGTGGLPDRTPLFARGYEYDADSNRTRDWDARPGAVRADRDWWYQYDGLDRLKVAYRGQQTPGANAQDFTVSTGSLEWGLDILGNWTKFSQDANGTWEVAWANNAAEREDRAHNMANELLDRTKPGPGGSTAIIAEPSYDPNGNIATNWPTPTAQNALKYTHDLWNRLVRVTKTSSSVTVLENEFNPLNWRVTRRMDLSKSAYNGVDEARTYYYSASWQVLEEHVDTDLDDEPDRKAQQFWGVRYIDDAVARRIDRDGDGEWVEDPADNFYYLTDVMFSVRAMTDSAGELHSRVDYTPYGVAMHSYAADLNGNGTIDGTDVGIFLTNLNSGSPLEPGDANYDPDADLNGDGLGGTATDEFNAFNARYSAYSTGGSNPTVNAGWIDNPTDAGGPDNSVGYDGYWFDLAGAVDNGSTGLYMVRHRVYDPGMGRWGERDPLEYIDGSSLYSYGCTNPAAWIDPFGTQPWSRPAHEFYPWGTDPGVAPAPSDNLRNRPYPLNQTEWFENRFPNMVWAMKENFTNWIEINLGSKCNRSNTSPRFRPVIVGPRDYTPNTPPPLSPDNYDDDPMTPDESNYTLGNHNYKINSISVRYESTNIICDCESGTTLLRYRWEAEMVVEDNLGASNRQDRVITRPAELVLFPERNEIRARWKLSGEGVCCPE